VSVTTPQPRGRITSVPSQDKKSFGTSIKSGRGPARHRCAYTLGRVDDRAHAGFVVIRGRTQLMFYLFPWNSGKNWLGTTPKKAKSYNERCCTIFHLVWSHDRPQTIRLFLLTFQLFHLGVSYHPTVFFFFFCFWKIYKKHIFQYKLFTFFSINY
jgi:hypothetical protein